MKNEASFSSKDKSKKIKCRLLQFLFGALRVNTKSHHDELVNLLLWRATQLLDSDDIILRILHNAL